MAPRLSTDQVSALKAQLQQRFDVLREEVRRELLSSDNERYLELAGRVHDPGDESVADLLVDVSLAVIDRHIDAVRETEAALLRIGRGTYGVCVDCGGGIDYERLASQPAAARCYDCQQVHERAFIHPGQASL
jgi:RNA polymerase-binding transcription factor DksA